MRCRQHMVNDITSKAIEGRKTADEDVVRIASTAVVSIAPVLESMPAIHQKIRISNNPVSAYCFHNILIYEKRDFVVRVVIYVFE